jgi:hypothetical protein
MEEEKDMRPYYERHRDLILQQKRDKYANDEEHRDRKKHQCLENYYRKKGGRVDISQVKIKKIK